MIAELKRASRNCALLRLSQLPCVTVRCWRAFPNYFITWGNSRKQESEGNSESLAAERADINYITGLLNTIKGIKVAQKGKGNVTGDTNQINKPFQCTKNLLLQIGGAARARSPAHSGDTPWSITSEPIRLGKRRCGGTGGSAPHRTAAADASSLGRGVSLHNTPEPDGCSGSHPGFRLSKPPPGRSAAHSSSPAIPYAVPHPPPAFLEARFPEPFLSPGQLLNLRVPASAACSSAATARDTHGTEPQAEPVLFSKADCSQPHLTDSNRSQRALGTQFLSLLNSTRFTLCRVYITTDLFVVLFSTPLQGGKTLQLHGFSCHLCQ